MNILNLVTLFQFAKQKHITQKHISKFLFEVVLQLVCTKRMINNWMSKIL